MPTIFGYPGYGNSDEVFDLAIYDKPGTFSWSKPSGCQYVMIFVMGAGSGGGSGRKGAASTYRGGGTPGGHGGITYMELEADALGASCEITVGTGGNGGAAVTANDTNGAAGSASTGTTSFGRGFNAYSSGSPLLEQGPLYSSGAGGTTTAQNLNTLSVPNQSTFSGAMLASGGFTNNSGGYGATSGFGVDLTTSNALFYAQPMGLRNEYAYLIQSRLQFAFNHAAPGGFIGIDGSDGIHGAGGGGGGPGTNGEYNSGAGGTGGNGVVMVLSFGGSIPCDLQRFSSNGVWYKPKNANFTTARVVVQAGGGGGGSGRRGATSTFRGGGAGGGGGGISISHFPLSALPDAVDVTVGLGGSAGPDPGANDLNGTAGGSGGDSFFGTLLAAFGGGGGPGGGTAQTAYAAPGSGCVASINSFLSGTRGDAVSSTGTTTDSADQIQSGGSGGGGISAGNVISGPILRRTIQLYGAGLFTPVSSGSRTPFANDSFFGLCGATSPYGGWGDGLSISSSGQNGKRSNGGGGGGGLTNGSALTNNGGTGGDGQVYILCF